MNNINIDVKNYNSYKVDNSENLIDKKLPPEILSIILSKLDNKSIENASAVCKRWNRASIDVARHAQYSDIKAYINSIRNELKEQSYGEFEIYPNKEMLDSKNLIEIDSFVKKQKDLLINTLKDLKEADLERLEESVKKQPTPKSFGDLFTLPKLYRKIDLAEQILDNNNKSLALTNIFKELIENGDYEKAEEVALMIPGNNIFKSIILRNISDSFTENGDYEKAVKVASMIPENHIKDFALQYIYEEHMKNGDYEKAEEVALMISDNHDKSYALLGVFEALTDNDDFKKSIKVALKAEEFILMIPGNLDKLYALLDLSKLLTENGDFEKSTKFILKAKEFALMIPDNDIKSLALQDISEMLTKNDR